MSSSVRDVWKLMVFSWLIASGCSEDKPFDGTCQCCTKLRARQTNIKQIASDGDTIYALTSDHAILVVQPDGTLTPLVSAVITMRTLDHGVAYSVAGASSPTTEIHELGGSTDRLLGSLASTVDDIQGNATDVYVLGESKLWRFPRSATDGAPVLVATAAAPGISLAIGATSAAWTTTVGSVEITDIPGPSTPVAVASSAYDLAFAGDVLFGLNYEEEAEPFVRGYNLGSIAPSGITLLHRGFYRGAGIDVSGASDRVFWTEEYDALDEPSGPSVHRLNSSTRDGHTDVVCDSWVSSNLVATSQKLYGLGDSANSIADGYSTIDVLDR